MQEHLSVVREAILTKYNPWITRTFDLTAEQFLTWVMDGLRQGYMKILYFPEYKVFYLMIRDEHQPDVAEVHCWSMTDKPYAIPKTLQKLKEWFIKNNEFRRLETQIIIPTFMKLVERYGWTKEGVKRKAYVADNGAYLDCNIYGMLKEDFE